MGSSVQGFNRLEGILHQRLGIGLRYVALQAEVATRGNFTQRAAITSLEVSRADLGRLHGTGILEAVARQALVDLVIHLVITDIVGDQRRLMDILAIIAVAILAKVLQGGRRRLGHQIGRPPLRLDPPGAVGDLGGGSHQGTRHQAGQHCSNQLFH